MYQMRSISRTLSFLIVRIFKYCCTLNFLINDFAESNLRASGNIEIA